jgi:cephalosporin hydroxylase
MTAFRRFARSVARQLRARLWDASRELAAAGVRIGPYFPPEQDAGLTASEREIVDRFHDLYYRLGQKGHNTNHLSWLGYSLLKCPLDLWIYHELICRLRPDVIIETGTASGGGALYLASMCALVGHGEVITIDVDARPGQDRPVHPRLSYLVGSSTDPQIIASLKSRIAGRSRCLVILDSDHRRDHVLDELRIYQQFVPVGGYLVVEDTNINGHPTYPEFGPGPMEALDAFLRETDAFKSDAFCERFLLTMNPRGFLRRIK